MENEHLSELFGSPEEDTAFEEQGGGAAANETPPAGDETPPPSEAPAQPEPGSEEAPPSGEEEQAQKQKTVPYDALHEERMRRKELQDELRQLNDKFAPMQERLAILDRLEARLNSRQTEEQQREQQEQQQREQLEFEADPIGALRKEVRGMKDEATQTKQQLEEARQQQEQTYALQTRIAGQVREFMKDTPDYSDAFNFLMERRFGDYRAMGVSDEGELRAAFDTEAMQLAAAAMSRGKNPGQVAYEMAKSWGYTPKAAGDATGAAQETPPGGSLEDELNRLERGQKASGTLSGNGGSANTDGKKLTLQDIDNMSDDEIDKLFSQGASIFG